MDSSSKKNSYDLSLNILLIGDSDVGKSSLLLSFISNFPEYTTPTNGVECKIKYLTVEGKKLKLTIWDTAGQDKYKTVTNSFYGDAHGIVLVYDVTQRKTFESLSDVWTKEIDLYSINKDCVKMLVGNKIDKESERVVSREEGIELAKKLGCLFLESSAKTGENVDQCFEELSLKIMKVLNPPTPPLPAPPPSPLSDGVATTTTTVTSTATSHIATTVTATATGTGTATATGGANSTTE